jgi:hypothetical protein
MFAPYNFKSDQTKFTKKVPALGFLTLNFLKMFFVLHRPNKHNQDISAHF